VDISCEYGNVEIPKESEYLIEEVAREIHNSWVIWRMASGFQYSEEQDYENKLHPHCRDWSELPEEHRKSDYLAAKAAIRTVIAKNLNRRSPNHKVAATCGCYDVMHDGHIAQLIACHCLADEVIVFLNSDESIKRIKGDHKPVMPLNVRVALLRAVRYVDSIIVFHEDTPIKALGQFFEQRPDVGMGNFFWLKPAWDYAKMGVGERDIIQSRGGIVLYFDSPVPERSSSDIIARIKESVSVLDF
jgi:rfaE bifunctional protein nucleotidyltransferase chain/domain